MQGYTGMAKIQTSHKLSTQQEEYQVTSGPYVFFRMIRDAVGFRLMTATAGDERSAFRAYADQETLINATAKVLTERRMEWVTKEDRCRRPYIETNVDLDKEALVHLSTRILDRLGFVDISVLARREMKQIYAELAISDSDDDLYLSDGVSITADGRMLDL